jgi:hypothetical protein
MGLIFLLPQKGQIREGLLFAVLELLRFGDPLNTGWKRTILALAESGCLGGVDSLPEASDGTGSA